MVRWIFRSVVGLLVVGAIGLGAVYFVATRSLPDMSGTKQLKGLSATVEIIRDAFGVPRIFAESEQDATFALGYVHATDRLWQMDLSRRLAQGRLAERFGKRALPTDKLMRALDLDGHAARSLDDLSPDTMDILNAYSAGVNARLAEIEADGEGRGAPEFYLFGPEIDPWTPADSVSVVKSMAFQISLGSLHRESVRGRMLLALDPYQVRDLFPAYPGQGVDALPERDNEKARLPVGTDHALAFLGLDDERMFGASGAWAVDGSRTAGRAPLLASDPHLPLTAPSIWHPAQMTAPGLSVIGAALPGVPAIAYGRNANIAWGLTATQADDLDIFIERLDEEDPTQYIGPDGPTPFEERTELIKVDGGPDIALTLRNTRHGPVVPLETAGLSAVTPEGHVPVLAWTAFADDDTTIEALLALNRTTSAEAAIKVASLVVAPALNLVVADKDTVGIAVAGRIPLRRFTAPLQGRVPSPGWTDRNDWVGWVRESALPRLIEPESGAVANANNRIGNGKFPRHLSYDWDAPYRINRIEKLINAREAHSIESFKAMQTDTVSETARAILALIGTPLWTGDKLTKGQRPAEEHALYRDVLIRLSSWNGEMSEHDAEPLIFTAWLNALTDLLIRDDLGPELSKAYRGPRPLFLERVFKDIDGASRWCDDISTEDTKETCEQAAQQSLSTALASLSKRYGADNRNWRWGAGHTAVHRNPTLGEVATSVLGVRVGLDSLVNIEQETSGGDDTLNRGAMAHAGSQPFRNIHGAGYRGVYDFSAPDRSVYIVSTGPSGHPLSEHYANLSPLWRIGEYMPMSLNRADFEPSAIGVLTIQPAVGSSSNKP